MIIKSTETTKDATLTANSIDLNFPVANILDSRLTRAFRTDASTTATIVFDAGAAITVNSICIANHNISSGVTTLEVQGNATDVWTSPSVDETLTYSSGIINKDFTGGSYRYWRLNIIDAGNSDGYIKLGRVGLYDGYTTPTVTPLVSHKRESMSRKTTTQTGAVYQDVRYIHSLFAIKWTYINHTQKAEMISEFDNIDIGKSFFITFTESNIDLDTYYVNYDISSLNFSITRNVLYYTSSASFSEQV